MAENQIKIEISAGTEELIKALQQADRAAVKFSGSVVSSISPIGTAAQKASNSISAGFKDAFSTLGKGVAIGNLVSTGILGVANAVTNFVTGTVAAAEEQEQALNRLGQALRASGEYSEEAVAQFSAFASVMQKTSVYGDEVVLSQVAVAKSFGATNEQAKQLVQAAANLAATMGGSLEERVQQLGKTLQGSAGKLGQLIPGFKALTDEQLRSGAAFDLINSKFGGAAANELNTYTGSVTALKNAFSDLQEDLGGAVTGSSYFKDVLGGLTLFIQEYVQSRVDARIAEERANGTLVETSESTAQLKRQYEELTLQLIDYEQVIIRASDPKNMVNVGDLDIAKVKVRSLKEELDFLKVSMEEANKAASAARADAAIAMVNKGPATDTRSDEEIQREKDKNAKILAEKQVFNQQLIQQQADFDAFQSELALQKTTLTQEQRAAEYQSLLEAEQAKIEAVRQAELARAQLIQDAGQRTAAINQINQKADLDRQKTFLTLKNKQEQDSLARKKALDAAYLEASQNFIQAGLVLAKEGSIAQKALQIVQATISTYTGATNALASVPYPANIAAASSIVALGLANVAKIAGAKFEQGGIVGGSSWHGDNVPARVNSGEMILNRQQQTELFRLANGSAGNNNIMEAIRELVNEVRAMPIVVQANGREIARLIRDEQRNGFEVFV